MRPTTGPVTWHEDEAAREAARAALHPARTLDRAAGEGPSDACCGRRHVAADMLVWIPPGPALDAVLAQIPHLAEAGAARGVYLCDGCSSRLDRQGAFPPGAIMAGYRAAGHRP